MKSDLLGRTMLSVCALLGAVAIAPSAARGDETASPRFKESEHFTIDPVVDGVLVVGGAGFSELLSLVLATGEIRPTVPMGQTTFLGIDRVAVTQTVDPHAGTHSNYGVWTAYGYALLDPILSGVRGGRSALLVDAIMYAESITLTATFTDITKIAVRRPRPIDYSTCMASTVGQCASNTDLQLSFFSGHTSATATISATATYLAFVRAPHSPRPWITLAAGTALTAFVAYERVRSGEHFPSDVIAATMVGAGIGVLVPHLHHRPHLHEHELEATPTWIGFGPTSHGQGSITAGWVF